LPLFVDCAISVLRPRSNANGEKKKRLRTFDRSMAARAGAGSTMAGAEDEDEEARMWARSVLGRTQEQMEQSDAMAATYEQTRSRVLRMMQGGDVNAPAMTGPVKPRTAAVKAPSSSPPARTAPSTVSGAPTTQRLKQSRAAIASAASALQREGASSSRAGEAERRPRTAARSGGTAEQRTRPNAEQLAAAVKAVRAEVAAQLGGEAPSLGVAVKRSEHTLARCSSLSSPAADLNRMTDPQRTGKSFHAWRCAAFTSRRQRAERCDHARGRLHLRTLTAHFWHWRLAAKATPPAPPAPAPAPKRGPSVTAVQRMLYRWDRRRLACALRRWRQRTVLVCVIRTEAQLVGDRLGLERLGQAAACAVRKSVLRVSLQQWRQRTARKARARLDERLRKQAKEIAALRTRLATSRALAVQSPPAHVRRVQRN
jgi:hypothetical protein